MKFSRMSKSNSLSKSGSIETPTEVDADALSPIEGVTNDILHETVPESGENQEFVPSSPPPSYEHVLEENRQKAQESDQSPTEANKSVEIIHKSSKELYKAVAKQFGITCKMSDQCRCLDCQSHYFDCEYEQNEQEKTDGGLGAGTPMFISEVIHGSACTIL
ncbi:uncharacterized protein LOC132700038 [Cylas formicarius]|uniref:uncharacterized protein LOC132700038 n=1 Tax=Cylas formicarius TaxID=197179 RepID=UPI0029584B33|nr:uncharacterized protein LOC132700038 [Cylas formicarius]